MSVVVSSPIVVLIIFVQGFIMQAKIDVATNRLRGLVVLATCQLTRLGKGVS